MRLSSWSLPALMLLAESGHVSAKAMLSTSPFRRSNDYDELVERIATKVERSLERRASSSSSSAPAASTSATLDIGDSSDPSNSTIAAACSSAMANITSVINGAGFTGCYNILDFNQTTKSFAADLRIYSTNHQTGNFAGVADNMILVLLNFPSSTTFKSLTKRTTTYMEKRQSGASLVQEYSLQGGFSTPLDMTKINETQIASLMVPQIKLQATTNGSTFSSNMTYADMALFTTGQFTNMTNMAATISNPLTAAAAITTAKVFVLPGRTFGIFPIGFIVTSVWTFLFVLMYTAGTIARYRYRSLYRKRSAALSGLSSYNKPGIGKF